MLTHLGHDQPFTITARAGYQARSCPCAHETESHRDTSEAHSCLCNFSAPQKGQKTGRNKPFLSDVSIAEARLPPCSVTARGSAELLRQAVLPEKL